jgi:hypothetical protein
MLVPIVRFGAVLLLTALLGCALIGPKKADVDVAHVAAAFETIERLGAVAYMVQPENEGEDCVYFQYKRGAFTSLPQDEFCRVFDFDNRQPGGGSEGPIPIAFDDAAKGDLAELKAALGGVGAPLDYMNLVLRADGSVGRDSGFAFDRCVMYWYEPGWTSLPEDIDEETVTTAIDSDWYEVDSCL